jgi:hypothetical protein
MRAPELEEAVWEAVLGIICDPERLLRQYKQELERQRQQMRGDPDREARSLVAQLQKLERRRSGYFDLAADGYMSREDLRAKLANLDEQRDGLQKALREARDRQDALRKPQNNYAHLTSLLIDIIHHQDLMMATPESRRRLYQALRLQVSVDEDRTIRISGVFDTDVYLHGLLELPGDWLSPRPKVPEGTKILVTHDNPRLYTS